MDFLITVFQRRSGNEPFQEIITEEDYNQTVQNIGLRFIIALVQLYSLSKAHMQEVFDIKEWETREFWYFSKQLFGDAWQLVKQIHKQRTKILLSMLFRPGETPDSKTFSGINEIMKSYKDLITILRQAEAHWLTHLQCSQWFEDDYLELKDFKTITELTRPKRSTGWDVEDFKTSDYHLLTKLYARVRWLYDHPIPPDVLHPRISEIISADDLELDLDSAPENTSQLKLSPGSSEILEIPNPVVNPTLKGSFAESVPFLDDEALQCWPPDPEQPVAGCSKNHIIKDDTPNLWIRKWREHLQHQNGPCLPDCRCFRCYLLNHGKEWDANHGNGEDVLDTVLAGFNVYLGGHSLPELEQIENSSSSGVDSGVDERYFKQKKISKSGRTTQVTHEKLFDKELAEFQYCLAETRAKNADTFWNQIMVWIVKKAWRILVKFGFRYSRKVHPLNFNNLEEESGKEDEENVNEDSDWEDMENENREELV